MSALGLPIALALGLVAELAGSLLLHLLGRKRSWVRPATRFWEDLRRLVGRKDRATALELVAVATGLTGAGLAGAAAMGVLAGGAALVYPALVLAVVGGHLAASLGGSGRMRDVAVRARANALVAESAFLLALGAGFLRWEAFDLEAMRGAQQVLGPGVAVGPPAVAAGLVLAMMMALVSAGLRLPPGGDSEGERGPAGSAVSLTLCRWAAAGATAMVVAVPLFGGSSLEAGVLDPAALWWWIGGAVALAVALGAARDALVLLPARLGTRDVALTALILAAGATALVTLS